MLHLLNYLPKQLAEYIKEKKKKNIYLWSWYDRANGCSRFSY